MGGVNRPMFEIKHRDGMARIAEFTTPHGVVDTPNIMPVVNPNVKLITPRELQKKFKSEVLITNSYVIYQSQHLKDRALERGLHSLLDFTGAIMTDSGTFQAHVYGELDIEPTEILDFQVNIGSDISTILDMFTEPTDNSSVVKKKVDTTVARAVDAMDRYGDGPSHIALPIQGGIYPDLREECAERLSRLKGSFYPIGGVVPLLENYRFFDLVNVIIASKRGLGPTGPVHLFGAGHPMLYPLAVLLGCDLFDSSSYAKYARRGDMMYPDGTRNIDDIEHLACLCPTCSDLTVEELKDLDTDEKTRKIAEHNLWVSYNEIEKVKQAVREESLWELVERRARAHPYLLKSLKALTSNWKTMEIYQPKGRKKALFYTGKSTLERPMVKRLKVWIRDSYSPTVCGPTIIFNGREDKKPYNRYLTREIKALSPEYSVNLLMQTPLGPIPLEMDEVYPVAQSIFPEDLNDEASLQKYLDRCDITDVIYWDGLETLESLDKVTGISYELMKVYSVCEYQFCRGAGEVLTNGELELVKNRRGRIKNVFLNGKHILSMRHYDGLFSLKEEGAILLHKHLQAPLLRVQVTEDSASYNAEGKNVFNGFVNYAWEHIRPGDEVLIVDPNDSLVAIARAFNSPYEMENYHVGLAARTRTGFSSSQS